MTEKKRVTSAEFIELELRDQLKTLDPMPAEAMHREAVAGALMKLAAAVRAGHVTSVEYAWEFPEDPVCFVKLRQPTGIIIETTLAELISGKEPG